jgi:hypothetical protein
VNYIDPTGLFLQWLAIETAKRFPKATNQNEIIRELAQKELDSINQEWPCSSELSDRKKQLEDLILYTYKNAFERSIDIVSQAGKDLSKEINREIENNSNQNSLPDGDFINSWRYFVEPQGVKVDH